MTQIKLSKVLIFRLKFVKTERNKEYDYDEREFHREFLVPIRPTDLKSLRCSLTRKFNPRSADHKRKALIPTLPFRSLNV